METARVAWLLPSAFFYWHPPISHFAKHFPNTKVFTGRWQGFAKGFEDTFQVEIVGERKVLSLTPAKTGYGNNFTYVSLKIVGKLLHFRPDIIFANSFGVWSIVALLLKPLLKWRVILAYEGSSPSVDFRDAPARLTVRRLMAKLADAFISNSQAGKAYLVQYIGVDENQVFVWPYEVPAAQALSVSSTPINFDASKNEHPIFLYVGQIIPRKGLSLLLDACGLLKQQGHDCFKLVIVGDGAQQPELETYAQKLQVSSHINWVGRVNYDQLGQYFSKADAFVLPTLEDTWGMVVLEAMILGTAVICSRFAGASELTVDNENGFVIDPEDTEALAIAMRSFITDSTLSERLGHGAAKCMARHSPEAAGNFLTKVSSFVFQK